MKLEPVLANTPIAPLFVEEALALTVILPLLIKLPVSFVKIPIEPSATPDIFPKFSPTPVPDIKAPIFSPFSIFTSPSLSLITFALSVNKPMFESFLVFRLILPSLISSVVTVFFFVAYSPIDLVEFSIILISPVFFAVICSEYIPKDSLELILILPLLVMLMFLI